MSTQLLALDMAGLALVMGFEPTYSTAILPSFSITCDITELHENVLAAAAGVEPTHKASKTSVLPLYYAASFFDFSLVLEAFIFLPANVGNCESQFGHIQRKFSIRLS